MKGLTSLGKVSVAACIRSCVATAVLCLGAARAGAVTVESNTKLSGDTDWTGQGAVTIAADATLDLNGYKLSVDGLAGTGAIANSAALGSDVIVNGDFEAVAIEGSTWGYADDAIHPATCPNWVGKGAGFTAANTPWTVDVKGTYSAFIQQAGTLSESVDVPEEGDYALTYSYKSRAGQGAHELNVEVDGQVCGKTQSAADWAVNTIVLHLAAGEHTIKFAGIKGVSDTSTILDDVSLRKVRGELHVVVPANQTADVSSVRLGGAFRLVAEGAGTCRLHADCDWRGLGGLTVAGKIDLNGHELRIADLEGSGEIADDSFDLTDPSRAGELATISEVTAGTAANLFKDNFARNGTDNDYRVIAQEQKLPLVCTYDFEAATVIDAYGIAVGPISDYMKRMPYSWKVEGSLDKSTWVTLDTRTGERWWAAHDYRRFTFENATGYRYYRLTISDSQGTAELSADSYDRYLELVQIEYGRKGADGVLRLEVPEGKTMENAGVSFKGNFKLVKEGAGTFKASVAKQLNLLGTEVREGKLVFGVAQDPLGLGTVKVAAGATIDMNGLYDVNTCYNYETAGTITQNFSAWTPNAKSFGSVTLTGDATFNGGNYPLDAVGAAPGLLDLNDHTLRIESDNLIGMLSPRPVSGPGAVEIVRGRVQIDGTGLDLSSANLSVGEDGVLKIVRSVRVNDFSYSGTTWQNDRFDGVRVQVRGTFRPGGVYPALKMESGSTVDLSRVVGVWNAGGKEPVGDPSGKKEYAESGSVLFSSDDPSVPITINVAGRTLEPGEQLVRWGAVPAEGVKFVFDDETAQSGCEPVVTEVGLFCGMSDSIAATAVWTGAARDGNVRNPGNWASTNFAGKAVPAAPCKQTLVTFAGDMDLQIPAAPGLSAAKVNFVSCRLTADCDWRGLDTVDTAGEIVLNGHQLSVSKLTGAVCLAGSDYESLEYIESPGPTDGKESSASKSQWINTEFKPDCNDRIEMGANFRAKWNHTLWCARKDTSSLPYSFTAFLLNSNQFRFDRYKAPVVYLQTEGKQNQDYTFVADGSARQVWINDKPQNPPWEDDVPPFTAGGPMVLFCSYSDSANIAGTLGNPGRYRLYYLRVYGSDGALKRNFVPVRRYSDGKLGVLDRVTGGFYANSGQGQFLAGPVIGPESMGEVRVDVPENEVAVNDGAMMRGAVRLVKDGLGVYQPNVAQSYNGGTVVNAGTLRFGTNDHPAGEALSTIAVLKDATLDMNDKYSVSTCIYNYELAGTIVQHSTSRESYKDANRCFGPSFTLLGNATVRGDRYNFGTPSGDGYITFKMNGHALTLETVNYSALGLWRTSDQGTFVFTGGPFEWVKEQAQGPTNATVVVESSASFKLGLDVVLGGFRYDGVEWTRGKAGLINVYGRYFADSYRPPLALKDGSTLDLNGYDYATKGVFSLDGGGRECASGTIGGVFPEAGATITVDVSKRLSGENRIRGNKMIATWTERPEDVNFVLDGESLAAGFELLVEDGGLRLSHKGFLILVK